MGRPSKFTPDLAERICTWIFKGNSIKDAAGAENISERTVHRWLSEGERAGSGPFWQFWQDATRARAHGNAELVAVVREAATDDPKVALEMLARIDPVNWGRKDMTEQRVEKRLLEVLKEMRGHVSESAYAEFSRAILAHTGTDSADVPSDGDQAKGGAVH